MIRRSRATSFPRLLPRRIRAQPGDPVLAKLGPALVLTLLIAALPTHAATFTVANASDSGIGSLRQAILDANATVGPDVIEFDIAGAGVHTIDLASALPAASEQVEINGYTQDGASPNTLAVGNDAVLLIEVSCTTGGYDAFSITGDNVAIRGLSIVDCRSGIFTLAGTTGQSIAGNFIGERPNGSPAGNARGITADGCSSSNFGGASPADRNVISNSTNYGLRINMGGSGNTIRNNYIGLNPAGNVAHGNGGFGIEMAGAATTGNVIMDNVISGNLEGIRMNAPGNSMIGNLIGTSATGTAAIPNISEGLHLRVGGNTVGGAAPGARNLISGNGQRGILINQGAAGNVIQGNYIGTDVTGSVAIPNGGGINVTWGDDTWIGGLASGEGNLISANTGPGVRIGAGGNPSAGNSVIGNLIGTDATGTIALGNVFGVVIQAGASPVSNTLVSRNVISGNETAGVRISGTNAANQSNVIRDNSIGTDLTETAQIANADGVLIEDDGGAQITGNRILFNTTAGVTLTGTSSAFESTSDNNCVVYNNIGVDNQTGTLTVFENNWWGAVDGPSGAGTGSGDSVSVDVDYVPFLGTTPPGDCPAYTIQFPVEVPTTSGLGLFVLMLLLSGAGLWFLSRKGRASFKL